ncbi:MAG: CD1247 N-terminal domain-containing protein [Limnochordia bacterium]
MNELKERMAYVRGLISGSDFYGGDQKAQQIWENLLSVMDGLVEAVEGLQVQQEEMEEYMEAIDNDLSDMEEELYADELMDDDDLVEMECPNCREVVCFDESFLYDDNAEISCPECGEVLYVGDDVVELEDYDEDDEE